MEINKILLDKAIELFQARQKLEGNNLKKAQIKQELGRKIYPGSKDETVRVSMNDMSTGKMKKVTVEWIGIIEKELGVDANFLFGLPSDHDIDFDNLCKS